jgi:flagellar assembly factor FliW
MKTCKTRFHGPISYGPQDVLEVADGLFGFSDETQFLLLEVPSSKPIVFVQSVRTQNLCFISLPVQVVDSDYTLALNSADLQNLGYSEAVPPVLGTDVLGLALLTIRDNEVTTANLQAPLVIDIRTHKGLQAIVNGKYSPRHPVVVPESKFAC